VARVTARSFQNDKLGNARYVYTKGYSYRYINIYIYMMIRTMRVFREMRVRTSMLAQEAARAHILSNTLTCARYIRYMHVS